MALGLAIAAYSIARARKAALRAKKSRANSEMPLPRDFQALSSLEGVTFRSGDLVLFTVNTALRYLQDGPYSHVGLVCCRGKKLLHTSPSTGVPRCEPLKLAIARALNQKSMFRRPEVAVRRLTMPKRIALHFDALTAEFVRHKSRYHHKYSASSLVSDVAWWLFLGKPLKQRRASYCSGLVADALRFTGVLTSVPDVVFPCHFSEEHDHEMDYARGCAYWPPQKIVG